MYAQYQMLKRIAAIGDIHAEDARLERALAHIAAGEVDAILAVGDIVDGPGDVNRCCEMLQAHDVHAVRGNHDRWLVNDEMRMFPDATTMSNLSPEIAAWLHALPATLNFDAHGGRMLLCHGLGTNDMKTLLPDESGYALQANAPLEKLLYESDYRYVIKGHSHRRMVRRIDNITFINAGTLRNSEPCFCIIDFSARKVQFFDFVAEEIVPAAVQELP